MARVLACAGRRSTVPFQLQNTNKKVYSAEEVSYYLFHNPATAEDYVKDEALADYYETRLDLPETAERLRLLKASEAGIKEYALLLFSVTLMYTEEEIGEYMAELLRLQDLKYWQKQKAKVTKRNIKSSSGAFLLMNIRIQIKLRIVFLK